MRIALRPIAAFLVIAFGLAWLIALPLWLGDGLASPLLTAVALATMVTPALAAVLVVRFIERPASMARALGLRPLGRPSRLIGFLALGLVLPIALILAALVVGTAMGVYHPDLVEFSAFRELVTAQLAAAGVDTLPLPIGTLVAIQCAAVFGGAFFNMIPALGEEIGWRGWLLPRLMPLGPVVAIVVSGVIWGLWHAPLVLLGYNYPDAPGGLGVLAMMGMCTVVGGVFGWLRLRSGSVWPAALAHGSFNAAAGLSVVFSSAALPFDATTASILGWTGWILPLVVVATLVMTGQFRARPETMRPLTTEGPTVARGAL
jgi:uncharacterized protein